MREKSIFLSFVVFFFWRKQIIIISEAEKRENRKNFRFPIIFIFSKYIFFFFFSSSPSAVCVVESDVEHISRFPKSMPSILNSREEEWAAPTRQNWAAVEAKKKCATEKRTFRYISFSCSSLSPIQWIRKSQLDLVERQKPKWTMSNCNCCTAKLTIFLSRRRRRRLLILMFLWLFSFSSQCISLLSSCEKVKLCAWLLFLKTIFFFCISCRIARGRAVDERERVFECKQEKKIARGIKFRW